MHPNGEAARLRMEFLDVNPPVHAWAAWRVYKIDRARSGQGGPRVSGARLSQAAAEFHLVGESQGSAKAGTFSRAVSSGSITSACSTAPPRLARRQFRRAIRRHQLDGHVLPRYACDGHGTGPRRSRLRRRGQQILRTFRLHLPGHERYRRRRGHRPVGRARTASTTTCCTCPMRRTFP